MKMKYQVKQLGELGKAISVRTHGLLQCIRMKTTRTRNQELINKIKISKLSVGFEIKKVAIGFNSN